MHSFMIAPTAPGTGLASVCLGFTFALEQLGLRVIHFRPVSQTNRFINFELSEQNNTVSPIIEFSRAQHLAAIGQLDQLMEPILEQWQNLHNKADVVIIEGLIPQVDEEYVDTINQKLFDVLACDLILISAQQHMELHQWNEHIQLNASLFGGADNPRVIGCILNKIKLGEMELSKQHQTHTLIPEYSQKLEIFQKSTFRCIGAIPWNAEHVASRFADIAEHLNANIIHPGQQFERRALTNELVASSCQNYIDQFKAGALVVTPGDRDDVIIAASLAEQNGTPLAGLILCEGLNPAQKIMDFCAAAMLGGLPVALVPTDGLNTVKQIETISIDIPKDDQERIDSIKQAFATAIDTNWLAEQSKLPQENRLSPPAFKHQIISRAQAAMKRIVLPEGEEPRTIQAAAMCAQKRIAQCVLLGDKSAIERSAEAMGISLPSEVEVVEPHLIRHKYVNPMVALRSHKGLTPGMAENQLEDNVVLGTMMLAQGEVDGLVSGAIHTTANTIRPALQLIKTRDDCSLVSSVFFMLLPEQTVVYGDCAVNPDPSAEELADIAVQAGETAAKFGITPSIAMISYSTGSSGEGVDVEKVRKATQLAKTKRPKFLIDGPLQYDAAAIESVAQKKAPDSPVAGHANVFIFPDLNTGNTTYKAVQRSAHVLSVGPILQGLKKPVNDLSRGALVEDILYTIAITAIQASAELEG